jgi:hypothetical protein
MDDDVEEDVGLNTSRELRNAYTRGSRVELTGLVSRASLNGILATVLEHISTSGRWAVMPEVPNSKQLLVKPENIKLVHDPAMRPINLRKLLMQLDPAYALMPTQAYAPHIPTQVTNERIAQRKALIAVLSLAPGHNSTDPLLNDPTCQILELSALDAITVQPRQLYVWALVCRAWAAAVKAWLASTAAYAFWQRVCAGMLPPETVLHPELCTKDMLREWAALPMAVGTKQQWYRCGLGRARTDEESEAMTELELGISIAWLFKLWWNIGDASHTSPRFVGWMRLYFDPFLTGRTHGAEFNPPAWELNGGRRIPHSLLANVCDCIQDFRMCPNSPNLPDEIDYECLRTLRALVTKFDCQTPLHTQWRFMTAPQITPAKNAAFFSLIRRYCPLFPQKADTVPLEVVSPVFKRGKRHRYEFPRPERWRLWPHTANKFLILDSPNDVFDIRDSWVWDQNVTERDERGVLEGDEAFDASEDEEAEDMDGDEEVEDDDVVEEDAGIDVY